MHPAKMLQVASHEDEIMLQRCSGYQQVKVPHQCSLLAEFSFDKVLHASQPDQRSVGSPPTPVNIFEQSISIEIAPATGRFENSGHSFESPLADMTSNGHLVKAKRPGNFSYSLKAL
ncbi:MAG: hypothetical protein DDT32_01083 [Syntrophomonadaceae bacterium]|nr:hypothetical protein [Bacillota bacterium]